MDHFIYKIDKYKNRLIESVSIQEILFKYLHNKI
jgi:hypothetical protein